MTKFLATVGAAAMIAGGLSTGAAAKNDDQASVELGTLTCEQTDRTNLVVWSKAEYNCVFDAVDDNPEFYKAKISKIGVDLTIDKIETMKWAVVAPSDDTGRGALEGEYVGASADVAAGGGAGVRALVGGGERSFTLQPVSTSAQTGLGAGIGIESLTLTHSGS